jgi:hypothetical protein
MELLQRLQLYRGSFSCLFPTEGYRLLSASVKEWLIESDRRICDLNLTPAVAPAICTFSAILIIWMRFSSRLGSLSRP